MTMDVCWCGPHAAGEKALAPMRQFRKPVRDGVVPTPYVALQASGDEGTAHGHKYYIKGGFVQKASRALIDVAIAAINEAKLPVVNAVVFPMGGGAYARVKPNATAFAQRAAEHNVFLFTRWDDPALSDAVATGLAAPGRKWNRIPSASTSTSSMPRMRRACGTRMARTSSGWSRSRRRSTPGTCSG